MPDTFIDPHGRFSCSWALTGVDAAEVLAVGEIDLATAPLLDQALREAADAARLTLLSMREVSFMDCSGLHVIAAAAALACSAARELVVAEMSPHVGMLFALTGTDATLNILPERTATPATGAVRARTRSSEPPPNPVNSAVLDARVMAVPARQLWLQVDDGDVLRAWAPTSTPDRATASATVELYVDHAGEVNGWWDRATGMAVNQRHLDRAAPPATGEPMACQGDCGLVWQAPAAARLQEHDERCLTCAGPLAHG